jgi:hypothetical protein
VISLAIVSHFIDVKICPLADHFLSSELKSYLCPVNSLRVVDFLVVSAKRVPVVVLLVVVLLTVVVCLSDVLVVVVPLVVSAPGKDVLFLVVVVPLDVFACYG